MSRLSRFRLLIAATALLAAVFFGVKQFRFQVDPTHAATQSLKPEDIVAVDVMSVDSSVNAPGEIQSVNNTLVECEIDRLTLSTRSRSLVTGGSTTILKIVPDGTYVKKGDLLCQLDSRQYEEMVRVQRINLQQAELMKKYTELDVEVSKIAIDEYKNGTTRRSEESLRRAIQVAEFEAERASRRMAWTRKMAEKGFVTPNAVKSDEQASFKADILLSRAQLAYDTFEKFTQPRSEQSLKSRLQSRTWVLTYYTQWVEYQKKRLKVFEDQVKKCTVIAPHDGMVIYANEDDGDSRVELGAEVRRGQDLFYLPDLENLQVRARLSQSVIDRVRTGMPVEVYAESIDSIAAQGVLTKIAQLPVPSSSSYRRPASQDVKNYYCLIRIQGMHEGFRPGMNAEVVIQTGSAESCPVIPPEVVEVEGDNEFCLVLGDDGLPRRRQIKTHFGDEFNRIVDKGLKPGDKVILKPRRFQEMPGVQLETVMLGNEPAGLAEKTVVLAGAEPDSGPVSDSEVIADKDDTQKSGEVGLVRTAQQSPAR
ncbi:MAG: efflux RND transporter periplasmic adaptor subunit [bacterium]